MGVVIYSNITGSFAFDDKGYLIEKVIFKENEIVKNNSLLEEGKLLDSERKLLSKHKGRKRILGFREIKDIDVFFDYDLFSKISGILLKDLKEFYKNNLLITKEKLKQSLSDDFLIINAVNNIEELDKTANVLVKRLREWYSIYNPEFSNAVFSNEKFSALIVKKDRKTLLKEINVSEKESVGVELKKEDLDTVLSLAKQVNELFAFRAKQEKYLEKIMKRHCPNLQALGGTTIGAKLIAMAGSLKHLVEFPSSTIQLLGAEKALFRHMKTGARPPKYGIIINHPFVAKAEKKKKGKAARMLADKISLAVKVDYFKGNFIGDKLKEDLEKRLK